MRKWKHTIQAKQFYHDDSLSIEEKGKLMGAAIERLPLDKIDTLMGDDFEDLADRFKHVSGFEDMSPVEEFDMYMSELYDMADYYGIWVETR